MALSLTSLYQLSNGTTVPRVGLGVYQVPESLEAVALIKRALQVGYRHIDTAAAYGNEASVGQAIRESGVSRKEIFVTTKLRTGKRGYDTTLQEFNESLQRLGLEYVDLYLMHSPYGGSSARLDSWKAMEEVYQRGLAKAIGVSNFGTHHLDELLAHCQVKPVINQIELHPWLVQKKITQYCQQHNIVIEAYSPLAQATKAEDRVVQAIARRHQKTWAQVLVRWSLQRGFIPLPKTANPDRLASNVDVYDFALSDDEMQQLDQLDSDCHICWDPTSEPLVK
ncbi:hypothetical protein H4R34_001844 [Dimargaris verticillata]|uniref:NADP-dependent oxidoreductase domain-containing protein n=1 Tax=Dimargaris verticillata TaxID=2761393 RepID=A0A9W8EEL6_9FUNG|nr:hypothetical protein H4R34_001844 [Dimargaris verticillata]